ASVDPACHDFFAYYQPRADGGTEATAGHPRPEANVSAPAESARPARVEAPAADPAPAATQAPAAPAGTTAPTRPAGERPAPATGTTATAPAAPAAPKAAPTQAQPAATEPGPPQAAGDRATAPARTTAPQPGEQPLRGVAARIAQNMDQSLSIPTATSVRAIPAKLLQDNRIVINNHLARGRGGKVSFTHLIGYALVKALLRH